MGVMYMLPAIIFFSLYASLLSQGETSLIERSPHLSSLNRATDSENSCSVRFKGKTLTFAACQKELGGVFEVYWNILKASTNGTAIETLFRAPTAGGYAGFGWGYSQMIGSNVAVAYANNNGEATIFEYFLQSKLNAALNMITPVRSLKNLEADLDGGFVLGYFTRKLDERGFPRLQIGKENAIWAFGLLPPPFAPTLGLHVARGVGEFDLSEGLQSGKAQSSAPEAGGPVLPEAALPSATMETEGGTGALRYITFRQQQLNFSRCVLSGLGDIQVYWNVRESDNEIDTLFRAPTNSGYVSFGWGYSEMVGSNAAVVYQDPSGVSIINEYAMTAKNTAGVQPTSDGNLEKLEVEVDGEFIMGRFTRKLTGSELPPLTGDIVPAIWAIGPLPQSPTSLTYHGTSRGTSQIDFTGDSSMC